VRFLPFLLEDLHTSGGEVAIATIEGSSRVHLVSGIGVELNSHLLPVRLDLFVDNPLILIEECRLKRLPCDFA
jgi:hypothetical protein